MRNTTILYICLLLAMSGLVACSTITGAVMDNRDLSTQADDVGIKSSIVASLAKENPLKATGITVRSFGGHVFLIGEADKSFRHFAILTAEETSGVRHVTAHWFEAGTASTVNDTALAVSIDSKLLFTRSVRSTQIFADVFGGNVVLTGILNSQEDIQRAIATVRSVSGVISVTNYLKAY